MSDTPFLYSKDGVEQNDSLEARDALDTRSAVKWVSLFGYLYIAYWVADTFSLFAGRDTISTWGYFSLRGIMGVALILLARDMKRDSSHSYRCLYAIQVILLVRLLLMLMTDGLFPSFHLSQLIDPDYKVNSSAGCAVVFALLFLVNRKKYQISKLRKAQSRKGAANDLNQNLKEHSPSVTDASTQRPNTGLTVPQTSCSSPAQPVNVKRIIAVCCAAVVFALIVGVLLSNNDKKVSVDLMEQAFDTKVPDNWDVVVVPDVCTFQIPDNMEVQNSTIREFNEVVVARSFLSVKANPNRVVAQQSGLNDLDKEARSDYCRVIVETEHGEKDDYPRLTEPLLFTPDDLRDLSERTRLEFIEAFSKASHVAQARLLTWNHTKIVRVNGVDSLHTSYVRQLGDRPPVVTSIYTFYNYDRMHRVTMAYQQIHSDKWEDVFGMILCSIKFAPR